MKHIITLQKTDLPQPFDLERLQLDLSIFIEQEDNASFLATDSSGTTIEIDLMGNSSSLAIACMYFVKGWLSSTENATDLLIALKAVTVELEWLNNNGRIKANAPERKRINARLDIARAAIEQAQG